MAAEVTTMTMEGSEAHFIDQYQAKTQIEKCEAQLREFEATGKDLSEAQRYLKIARSFYRLGSFTKAFLFAVRARRVARE
ncbi:MAG: hypothetical protein QW379_07280 [Thermoplasmata archaeon]